MHLRILLPYRVFCDRGEVARIVVETDAGSFGLLPHRRDCVATLVPGILTWQRDGEEERYVAVDEGVLVKTGADVSVAVRNAIDGADLAALRTEVEREFTVLDEQERSVRAVLAKLESGFVRRFMQLHRD
jgi:F-type H+-transporting ATPase subunit epsilon